MPKRNTIRKPMSIGILFIAALASHAAQFVLFDTLLIHRGTKDKGQPYGDWESHLNFKYAKGVPKNWRSPHDYYNGKLYWRFEIQRKGTRQKSLYQFCMNNEKTDGQYWHCCNGCIRFDTTGVFRNTGEVVSQIWCHVAASWTNFKGYPQLVLKDGASHCTMPVCTNRWTKWEGYPNMKLYYPLTVQMNAYIVSKGTKFNAPSWWWSARFRKDSASVREGGPVRHEMPFHMRRLRGGTIEVTSSADWLNGVAVFNSLGRRMGEWKASSRGVCRVEARGWLPGVYILDLDLNGIHTQSKFMVFP